MISSIYDMCEMTITSTGNGITITLGSAVNGFQSFSAAGVANNASVTYAIQDINNTWEAGYNGTYITNSSGNFFVRSVLYSSNSNSYIGLSGNAVIYSTFLKENYDTLNPANSVNIGSNVVINTTSFFAGNSTANTFSNSTVDIFANSTSQTVITPISFSTGNSTANSFGNSIIDVIANSISQTVITAAGITIANSTVTSTVMTTGNTATVNTGYLVTVYNIANNTTGNITLNAQNGNYQAMITNGAFSLFAPTSDCALDLLLINGANAGTLTPNGFTQGSSSGDTYANTYNATASVTCNAAANPFYVTYAAHGLQNNAPVFFTAATIPTGMTANTIYYAQIVNSSVFQLSTTINGASIANTVFTSNGTTVVAYACGLYIYSIRKMNGIATYITKSIGG